MVDGAGRAENFLVREIGYLVYTVPRLGLSDDIIAIGVSGGAKRFWICRR